MPHVPAKLFSLSRPASLKKPAKISLILAFSGEKLRFSKTPLHPVWRSTAQSNALRKLRLAQLS